MSLFKRYTLGQSRVSWRHGDFGGLGNIIAFALLHGERFADDRAMRGGRMKGRDSIPAGCSFDRCRKDFQGSRAAALQERTDLLALSKKRLHLLAGIRLVC
jgi:hypothetical protein